MSSRYGLVVVGLLLVAGAIKLRDYPRGGLPAPPLTLGAEPVQQELEKAIPVLVHRGERTFFLIKTHTYALTARVLAAHAYDYVWTNDFFDVDLGVAWGDQVDRLTSQYHFYQDARFLFWRSDGPVADPERDYITTHVGNVHTIPAEGRPDIGRALRWVGPGDLVSLEGYLVVIQDAGTNELARSSTTRTDTGAGACEIMWVDHIQVNGKRW